MVDHSDTDESSEDWVDDGSEQDLFDQDWADDGSEQGLSDDGESDSESEPDGPTNAQSLERRYASHAPRVFAEMPRVSHAELDEVKKHGPEKHKRLVRLTGMLRESMWCRQRRNKCFTKRCRRGVGGCILPYCKYGFPQPPCEDLLELNDAGNRYNYRRRLVSPPHKQKPNTSDAHHPT